MGKGNGAGYSPLSVLRTMQKHGVPVPVKGQMPKPLVDQAGDAVYEPPAIETCCVLLLALTNGSKMVPDDFHNVEKSGAGLRAYARPDGGVYRGAFEIAKQPASVVLVYGDPLMSEQDAQRASMAYRARLVELYEGERALGALGPFAAGEVGRPEEAAESPSPALSDSEEAPPLS